jgi:GNAT superfamily N-acetyltransferase
MAAEQTAARIDFKSAGPDFWKRFHAYRRLRQQESRPDEPQRPDDLEERRRRHDNPFQIQHHYEIARDGVLLSWFSGSSSKPGTAGHESNKHLFWADLYVRPEARRHRLASSWLPLIVELMETHGCTVLGIGTEEPSGHAFLRWLGAEGKFSGAENRLALAGVDWKLVDRWIAQGSQRSPRTRLEIYDGPLPEAMWNEFGPQLASLVNSAPWEDMDHGEVVITPDHMRDLYARLKLGDERLHTMIAREPDGTMSAVTDTTWAPHRPAVIEQRFTGVRPDARGRGLGKWIKAAMLAHLRELYPEAGWVVTDNAGSNAPMLAINKKLGFKEFRAGTEYQISREALAARIRSLPVRKP